MSAYQATLDRMEPDIAMVDTGAALASIAISMKRIADSLASLSSPALPVFIPATPFVPMQPSWGDDIVNLPKITCGPMNEPGR